MIKTIIVGYGKVVSKLIEGYMDRLENYLPIYYPSISWQLYEARLKEATVRKYEEKLKDKVLTYNPNIVFIELGSDEMDLDAAEFVSLAEYEQQVDKLLETIKGYNNRTGLNGCVPIPILITPIPINESKITSNRTNNRIKQYVYRTKVISSKHNCPIVDLFGALSEVEDYKELYLDEDGIRLNSQGEDFLYDMVFIELIRLINYQGVLKDRFVE